MFSYNYALNNDPRPELCEGYFTKKCVLDIPYFQDKTDPLKLVAQQPKASIRVLPRYVLPVYSELSVLLNPTYYIYK